MLRKDAEPDWENPTDEQTKAFETLDARLISPRILALPKAFRPYVTDTDASAYQVGATLLQQQEKEKPNDWVRIGYCSKTLTDTERKYSRTERECYSVVWSVATLRPYIEGLKFTVRTDHDAFGWLMKISDSTGRLMRWRLRLSEFDFTVKYSPVLVSQVPDALSRVLTPEGKEDKPIDDEVPTYGDHKADLVTTRRKAAKFTPNPPAAIAIRRITRKRTKRNPTDAGRRNTKYIAELTDEERLVTEFRQKHINHNTTNDDEAIDDVLDEDLDIFDMSLACQDDGRDLSIADFPVCFTKDKLLEAQSTDDFCQTVLSRQSRNLATHFFESNDGLLRPLVDIFLTFGPRVDRSVQNFAMGR